MKYLVSLLVLAFMLVPNVSTSTDALPVSTAAQSNALSTSMAAKANPPGFEIACPDETHPKTAILKCPVNPLCPDVDGVSTATVSDYELKPADGTKSRVIHRIKSVSPCGCVFVKDDLCDCVPNGTYKGTCKSRLCTY